MDRRRFIIHYSCACVFVSVGIQPIMNDAVLASFSAIQERQLDSLPSGGSNSGYMIVEIPAIEHPYSLYYLRFYLDDKLIYTAKSERSVEIAVPGIRPGYHSFRLSTSKKSVRLYVPKNGKVHFSQTWKQPLGFFGPTVYEPDVWYYSGEWRLVSVELDPEQQKEVIKYSPPFTVPAGTTKTVTDEVTIEHSVAFTEVDRTSQDVEAGWPFATACVRHEIEISTSTTYGIKAAHSDSVSIIGGKLPVRLIYYKTYRTGLAKFVRDFPPTGGSRSMKMPIKFIDGFLLESEEVDIDSGVPSSDRGPASSR